ncbi:T cell receptor gamma variable 4, partial [Saguinus oedipus]
MKSVTVPSGSSAVITCDLPKQSTVYHIHWYLHQERKVPRHLLLYHDPSTSKVVVESGISPGKDDTFASTRRSSKSILKNLIENDSGVYYCHLGTGTV